MALVRAQCQTKKRIIFQKEKLVLLGIVNRSKRENNNLEMENLRLLGGSAGTLLIENNGRFYPVCDGSFKKSHKKRLADQVCRQLGLGQVLFVGNKEEKSQTEKYACENWESSCEKCFDAFLVVGGKCSRQKNDKQSSVRQSGSFTEYIPIAVLACFQGITLLLVRVQVRSQTRPGLVHQRPLRTADQMRSSRRN